MPQWQYTRIDLNDVPIKIDGIDLLNDAGKDGWEPGHVPIQSNRDCGAGSDGGPASFVMPAEGESRYQGRG